MGSSFTTRLAFIEPIAIGLLVLFGCKESSSKSNMTQAVPNTTRDPLILPLDPQDPRIQGAIRTARGKIDYFMHQLRMPSNDNASFAFLIYVEENGKGSGVWVTANRDCVVPDEVCGTIAEVLPEWRIVRVGQQVVQDPKDVLDWRIIRAHIIEGAFTTRVLLSSMTPEDKAELEQRLGGTF